jgi:multicomponent Na+:H+ antiporter subunit D
VREHLPVLPVLVPLAGALLVPIAALGRDPAPRLVALVAAGAAAASALAGLVSVAVAGPQRYALGGWAPPWGIELVLDPLSAFVTSAITAVALATLVAAGPGVAIAFGAAAPAFHALALLLLGALCGIVVSGDLFNVFVFLEVSALAAYALVAAGGGRALVAAFRYLVLGAAGGSFYLLGVGLLYALTGTLNMADLADRLRGAEASPLLAGGLVLTVVGLAIKMGLFPLHQWQPDVYTYAPAPVAAFIAPVATKAAAYAVARIVLHVVPAGGLPVTTVLTWAGALAVLVGGVQAVRQTDARRLLAYSSVSQMGYIAIGVGLANAAALTGAYLHILGHGLMKAALFLAVGAAGARGVGPAVLSRRMPVTATCAVVAGLSLVGVPPLAGFFSKWYLLLGALEARRPLLVATILAGSLLGAAYVYRLTEAVWTGGESAPGGCAPREAPRAVLAGLIALTIASLAVGLGSAPLVSMVLGPAAAR